MCLRHLIKIGPRWVNPSFVTLIEDASHHRTPPPPDEDSLVVTTVPGPTFVATGDDARRLRRMLADGEDEREEPAAASGPESPGPGPAVDDAGPPETLTGHGPGPLVRRVGQEARAVAP